MSRITVCLDCPLYQTGGWCKHKRKDVGALQPACDHAKKMNETFNPEDKEEEPMTDMNTRTEATKPRSHEATKPRSHEATKPRSHEATKLCKKCGRELTLDHFGKKNGTKDGLQYWCKECTTRNALEARRAKKAAKAQTETAQEPTPVKTIVTVATRYDLTDAPDQKLADELRRRGWDVKATRPKTIIEEL